MYPGTKERNNSSIIHKLSFHTWLTYNSYISKGKMGQQDIAGIQKGNINVVVRVRPLNNSERFANESNVLQFPGNGGIVATSQDKGNVIKSFTFNVVFEPEATQVDVFEHCGIEEVVDLALAGYSTTCICYGQTGSGKTHTLSGPPNLVSFYLRHNVLNSQKKSHLTLRAERATFTF